MLRTRLQMSLQIMRTPCKHLTNEAKCVANACPIVFICHLFASKIANNINVNRNRPQCQGAWKNYIITDQSLLLEHTPLCCFSQIAIYIIKKRQFYCANQNFTGLLFVRHTFMNCLKFNTINNGFYLTDSTRINKLC